MIKIKSVHAREVLDSRGHPTVEAEVNGYRAITPAGASKGKHEAVELRDGEKRYNGLGAQRAVNNVNKIISKHLVGKELNQKKVDEVLCGLAGNNKWKLGANATTAVSMATCKALDVVKTVSVMSKSRPCIPVPFMNVINGGAHAENNLNIQEFMLVPLKFSTFSAATQAACEIYYNLKEAIIEKYGKISANVGDEGGFAPNIGSTRDALMLLWKAIDETGYADNVKIAIDAAASQFFHGKYSIDGKLLDAAQLADYYIDLTKIFPIISIEDPFHEEDFDSFALLKNKAKRCFVVGDDLTATNPERIKKAIEKDSCNSLLVKINQIGTVTEAVDAAVLARKSNWNIIVSHRSGDSEDTFIADFAVALGTFGAKFGAPARSERTAKYNQLLRLEEELKVPYAGKNFKLL